MRFSSSNRKSAFIRCPTCGRRVLLDETAAPPFCSERCQLIDLGRWLDEEVSLPYEGDPGEALVEDWPPTDREGEDSAEP